MHDLRSPNKQPARVARTLILATLCVLALAGLAYRWPPIQPAYAIENSSDSAAAAHDGGLADNSASRSSKTGAGVKCSGGIRVSLVDRETHLARPLGAARLSGARIAIVLVSPQSITIGKKRYRSGDVVRRITTKADGVAQTGAHALPRGTYRMKMQKASRGYRLDKSWKPTVKIRTDGKIHLVKMLALQAIRDDARIDNVFGEAPDRRGPTAFLVTSKTSGEQHVLIADGTRIDTSARSVAHTQDTNANDALIATSEEMDDPFPNNQESGIAQTRFVQKASLGAHLAFPTLGAHLGPDASSADLLETAEVLEHAQPQDGISVYDPSASDPLGESGETPNAGNGSDAAKQDATPDGPGGDVSEDGGIGEPGNEAGAADGIQGDNGEDGGTGETPSAGDAGEGETAPTEIDDGSSGDADPSASDESGAPDSPSEGTADAPGGGDGASEPASSDTGSDGAANSDDSPDAEDLAQGDGSAPPEHAQLGASDIAAAIKNQTGAESVEIQDAAGFVASLAGASACDDIPFIASITIDGKANELRLIATPQEDGSIAVRDALTDDEVVFIDASGNVETGAADPSQMDGGGSSVAEDGPAEEQTGASSSGEHSDEPSHDTANSTSAATSDEPPNLSPDEGPSEIPGENPDSQSTDGQSTPDSANETDDEEIENGDDVPAGDMSDGSDPHRGEATVGEFELAPSGEPAESDSASEPNDDDAGADNLTHKAEALEPNLVSDAPEETATTTGFTEPDLHAGIWFSGSADTQTEPDDALGALPFDTYTFQELRGTSNAGMELTSFEVEIGGDSKERVQSSDSPSAVAKRNTQERKPSTAKPAKANSIAPNNSAQATRPTADSTSSGKGSLFDQTGNLLGRYWWAFASIAAIGICASVYAASLRRPEYTSWGPSGSAPNRRRFPWTTGQK